MTPEQANKINQMTRLAEHNGFGEIVNLLWQLNPTFTPWVASDFWEFRLKSPESYQNQETGFYAAFVVYPTQTTAVKIELKVDNLALLYNKPINECQKFVKLLQSHLEQHRYWLNDEWQEYFLRNGEQAQQFIELFCRFADITS
jgi:hypothetical protein